MTTLSTTRTNGQVIDVSHINETNAEVNAHSAILNAGVTRDVSFPGTLAAGIGSAKMVFPVAATLLGFTAALGSVANQDVIVDVNKNGTTIFSTQGNRPKVTTGGVVGTEAVPNTVAVAAGNYLTFDIDQVGGGAAPTYVGNTKKTFTTTSPLSVARPAGSQAGDMHYMFITVTRASGDAAASVTQPAGWTQVGSTRVGIDDPISNLFVYEFRDVGSGSWPYSFTCAPTTQGFFGTLVTVHGLMATGTAVDAFGTAAPEYGDWSAPSITTTAVNDLVLYVASIDTNTLDPSPPTGFTEISTGAVGMYLAYKVQAAAGATGVVATSNNTRQVITGLLALKADTASSLPGADLTVAVRYR